MKQILSRNGHLSILLFGRVLAFRFVPFVLFHHMQRIDEDEFNPDQCSGRSFGKRSLARDQENNFGNFEMIEKSDHQELCIMENKSIE
uniref:Uncharacterized protein n=1 Tax=Romanomermis culicivorax TaxID=13658 RepID=A0A915KZV2_ROMCU